MNDSPPDDWIECPQCEGNEGWNDDNDCWHDCPMCEGNGGWNDVRDTDQSTEVQS
jgi:hypothetical protein